MSSTRSSFSAVKMMGSLAFGLLLTVLVVSPSDTDAFQHVAVHHRSRPSSSHTSSRSRPASRLAVVPPPVSEIDSLVNHLVASTSTVADLDAATSASALTSSFSQLLADAAAATADAAAQTDGGWWKAYLNIFKTAIEAVHDTIDPPLRSVGFTQTWGVSIALFTAGTLRMMNVRCLSLVWFFGRDVS